MILNWIRKRLGYHVCEEWTQWEKKTGQYVRTHHFIGGMHLAMAEPQTFTQYWQERRCEKCGLVQQRRLEN